MNVLQELRSGVNTLRRFHFFKNNLYVYPRMFSIYWRNFFGYKTPRNIVIQLSQQCNVRCYFCYALPARDVSLDELTQDEVAKAIDFAHDIGVATVTFSGGEPLIYRSIEAVISYACEKRLVSFTSTNGQHSEASYLKKLKKAGLVALNFNVYVLRGQPLNCELIGAISLLQRS